MKYVTLTTLLAATVAFAGPAFAEYPERPITLIVPWSAGGGTDAVGRMLAKGLQEELGTPVNVVNRTGAGGIVGHTAMIDADPDGYTLCPARVQRPAFRSWSPAVWPSFRPRYRKLHPCAMQVS